MELSLTAVAILFLVALTFLILLMKYFDGPLTTLTHSMKGQTILITGGDSHIGWEVVKDLIAQGARVIMACRNDTKANSLVGSFKDEDQKKRAIPMKLDLTNFNSIKKFVAEVKNTVGKIDILINNAGTCFQNVELIDGLDNTFYTNYAGHLILTALLLEDFNPKGRIVNVTTTKYRRISKFKN